MPADGTPDRQAADANQEVWDVITKTLTALTVCALFAQAALAQAPGELGYEDVSVMPGGVEGERIQRMIDLVNAGDLDGAQAFYDATFTEELRAALPVEYFLEALESFSRSSGGVDFHSVRTYTPPREETVVIVQDRNFKSWRAISFMFDEEEDGLISSIRLNAARTPSNVDEPTLTEAEALAEMEEMLDRVCANDTFSGTVLVAKGDDVLLTRACGEATKRWHVPNNIDTKFNLGSMNKMVTATSIAQLVERGLLSFDEPISEHVDETWLPREMTEKITVHHLLTHTSGLGSYFNEAYDKSSRKLFRAVDDYKPLVVGDTLAFEPGADNQYSNTGMLLLGVVIESVTGEDYFDYVRANIYGPVGMADSDSYDMDCPVENLAMGYFHTPTCAGGWTNNLYEHVIRGGPAGGGFSTVGDLHRFARALLTGKLVSDEMLETLWTDHTGVGYGYGFGVSETPVGKVVGHGGGFVGINGNLDIFVEGGYVAAVLANYDGAGSPVDSRIGALLQRVR